MAWKTLDDMDLAGKVVLVRVDINVPVEDGRVTDATRIERIKPTVDDILKAGGKPVLLAHFGRPKGQVVPEMSLKITLPALEEVFGRGVIFADDCIGLPAKQAVAALSEGDILLLENTRFHEGEEKNDPALAAAMAALGDIYVNDAFSAAHRAHASTEGIAKLLPCCAGRLMEAELKALEGALGNPARPLVAVVGGAKVSTKLDLLGNLVGRVDYLVIGGGMANTFLAAQEINVGKSLCEHDMTGTARDIKDKADTAGCQIVLPVDVVVAREFRAGAVNETVAADACPADAMILDAGPQSVELIEEVFDKCKTLIWNGPLGAFEIDPFDAATNAAAKKAAELTEAGQLVSVAGGGDTVAALNGAGAAEKFSYISTAGGAFLEWMEGKTLPGVAALED
ncbi:phosphoglycerate kinase [Rhodovulum sulfidophilum]|uniref:phosphoglycerate kinase n=1 Tax=Rhodovulum sulfidophilum TaxID=35806 RepID=UPI0005A89F73|nr:phosphoglycerate kinase [Rhodovulum sulfidophilum]ANB34242.1 phosphoglycerate kinase [Rhodovulum sulfidophilum DSM 1374]ANB38065.1 phosphoglycerate kinase [Rhodovulum sulfidophilum]MBK5924257.1 phosphoglycerate kinase [Rhodovulum sulfidophilum]MBL3552564.1 phosphoglycerate kinase [Rhodovulum sulfidophilum]MBL3566641.1 phosphoglycerate kinase [Rhodovulum sulfidophilum]